MIVLNPIVICNEFVHSSRCRLSVVGCWRIFDIISGDESLIQKALEVTHRQGYE